MQLIYEKYTWRHIWGAITIGQGWGWRKNDDHEGEDKMSKKYLLDILTGFCVGKQHIDSKRISANFVVMITNFISWNKHKDFRRNQSSWMWGGI